MSKKAFTLVELVMVIVVVAVLSAIALPRFVDLIRTANEAIGEIVEFNKKNIDKPATSQSILCN